MFVLRRILPENVKVTAEILFFQYLATADFAMREELSLKAAILAEKFAPDLSWCVIIYELVLHISVYS